MLYIIPTDTCFGIACQIHDIEGYNMIYSMKGREYNKPLAILVDSLDFLLRHTSLSPMQADFLHNYRRPFTVLVDAKSHIIDPAIPNKSFYKKVAFRIAHNAIQKKLLSEKGPLFLTSANMSGEGELYCKKDLAEMLDREDIEFFYENDLDGEAPSDIFEFIGNTSKIIYLRKN